MPELPEVETVARDLRPALIGRTLVALRRSRKRLRRPWKSAWETTLLGARIEAIRRRGKWIILDLASGSHLVVHLGMSGQFTVTDADAMEKEHTHLTFTLDNGRLLRYCDIRRFGSVTLLENDKALDEFFAAQRLGPEPPDLDRPSWHAQLLLRVRCLKAVLLDQRVVAGVGNIYADESLFEARLHPATPSNQMMSEDAERLRQAIVAVLERAIARRGSSIRNYVGGSGLKGGYQDEFRVYGRTGQPCRRCATPVECVRLAGRSSHFCPSCQAPGGR